MQISEKFKFSHQKVLFSKNFNNATSTIQIFKSFITQNNLFQIHESLLGFQIALTK